MIYHLTRLLQPTYTWLNFFHYVSFRSIAALLTALSLSLILGPWFIAKSKELFRSKARDWTPDTHRAKDFTPTMGGILIIFTSSISCLAWCDLTDPKVWLSLFALIGFGIIGFWDDWTKIKQKKGISARSKFMAQWVMALSIVAFWGWTSAPLTTITIPFFKHLNPDLGIFFFIWAAFIIVSCSNAVNLTDGLDGLALSSLIPNFATYTIISYLAGHAIITQYLHIPFAGTAEIAIVGSALIGSCLGFLWYNSYPAQIFMGDVGSLALGAVLAVMALLAKQEILFVISGALFVLETVSVMLQVFWYKRFKRRIFKMAPIHHHFELLGWPEAKITVRFAIISLILCLLALITLKIR